MLDELNKNEKEFFIRNLMTNTFGIFSPFEFDENVDFPKKDELGGVILKFIGGGAVYFKIQTEMPSEEELNDIHNVGKFLKENFGEYVHINVLCTPDIEIYDIDVDGYDVSADFVSARKSYGDVALRNLTGKLQNNVEFTEEDHFLRFLLPFMGRENEDEFEKNYSYLLDLYYNANLELPNECKLDTFNFSNCRFSKE